METHVAINSGLVGTLTIPGVTSNTNRYPAVLMLHGFASSKDEVGGFYSRLATELSQLGIVSLRFDFHGWGQSSGDRADTTITQQVADAVNAYEFLSALDYVDASRVGLVGFSLGAGIGVLVASNHPNWMKSMVLWSPVGDLINDFKASLGENSFKLAEAIGAVEVNLGWTQIRLRNNFMESLDHSLYKAIKLYKGPLLLVAGSCDASSHNVEQYLLSNRSMLRESIILDGQDHIFHVLGDDQTSANYVIQKTAEWFKRTLEGSKLA